MTNAVLKHFQFPSTYHSPCIPTRFMLFLKCQVLHFVLPVNSSQLLLNGKYFIMYLYLIIIYLFISGLYLFI
jgi:hypothetical protein